MPITYATLPYTLLVIIYNQIEGEPREKLKEVGSTLTYNALRQFLKKHYETKESFGQAYSKLASTKQNHNETCQQFGDRITNLAYRAKFALRKEKGLTEASASQMISYTALERYKIGSRTEISRFIRMNPNATDLAEAINLGPRR